MGADVPRGSSKLLWYELGEADSIAAIFPEQRRGIYVLEFANGERYVGQAEDAVKRFTQHRHGSKHHEPWTDITAFGFRAIPEGALTPHELAMFRQQKAQGYALRNKTWNYEHEQPSPLDEVVPVEVQKHWVTGYFPPVDRVALAEAVAQSGSGEPPKLFSKKRGMELLPSGQPVHDAVVENLAKLILLAIPQPVETEGRFWMISDYPGTSGGRFATLNVGNLELAYFPRGRWPITSPRWKGQREMLYTVVNAEAGTLLRKQKGSLIPWSERQEVIRFYGDEVIFYELSKRTYSVPADALCYPLGSKALDRLTDLQIRGIRCLAVRSMRNASARVNVRSRSEELTKKVYARMLELAE